MPFIALILIGVVFALVFIVATIFAEPLGLNSVDLTIQFFHFLYILFWFFISFCIFIIMFGYLLKKPSMIKGVIQTYSNYWTSGVGIGIAKKSTFIHENGSKEFFKAIYFRRNLWSSSVVPLNSNCIFFIDRNSFILKKYITVWGVQYKDCKDNNFIFIDDMGRPGLFFKLLKLSLVIISVFIIFTSPNIVSVPICLFVIVYQIISYTIKKRLFEQRMKLLDEAGVPRPLG